MKLGRIVFEIYRDFAPIAGDNFVRLCRGERGLSYKGSTFYWIAPGYACMGGNITRKGSSQETSVYGGCFKDEGHLLRFAGPGVISTFNFKKGRNSSRFMITFRELTTQNERFVVFGRVIRTLKVLEMVRKKKN
ncbi:hypothetical protein AAG570_011216 [Ranatra chinensis]|uniref:Peptidyl-prolyl cis-trans isomerase n=1 Tax=Ranatra chinensis TaxID=642074 RepID=A0ABD0YYB0_9HEMI